MTHFTPAEFVDAAEGTLDLARLRHRDRCVRCRRELAAIVQLIRDSAEGPVPEPSPLFWERFASRVHDAIAAEPEPRRVPWDRLRWSALVPLTALAALVLAIVATMARPPAPRERAVAARPEAPLSEAALHDVVTADAEWHALAELVGPLEWDAAGEAGLMVAPGDAEVAMLDLSDEERRELSRLIAGELARDKS